MTLSQKQAPDNPPGEIEIADMTDDTLAEMWHEWMKDAAELQHRANGAFQELEARMRERGATVLDTEHWKGKMVAAAKNPTVDNTKRLLERLIHEGGITGDDILKTFPAPKLPPLRPHFGKLNELRKRGGVIAEIIDEECKTTQGDAHLKLERKKV